MEKRFRSLRIIGSIFKILAWVVLVLGILGGIIMVVAGLAGGLSGLRGIGGNAGSAAGALGGLVGGFAVGIGAIFAAVLYFLCLYSAGDAIYLALAIEENTRETAYYLKGSDAYARRPQ